MGGGAAAAAAAAAANGMSGGNGASATSGPVMSTGDLMQLPCSMAPGMSAGLSGLSFM